MLKIPENYRYLTELLNQPFGRISRLTQMKVAIYGIAPIDESPIIAGIYLLNGKTKEFEVIFENAMKYRGKKTAAVRLLSFIIEQDMGIELATEYWNNRNILFNHYLIKALQVADEKYMHLILSSDKFYKLMKVDIEDKSIVDTFISIPKLMTIGESYPKFVKLCVEIFNKYEDARFISNEAHDIFLF